MRAGYSLSFKFIDQLHQIRLGYLSPDGILTAPFHLVNEISVLVDRVGDIRLAHFGYGKNYILCW